MPSKTLKAMTDAEVNDYMESLAKDSNQLGGAIEEEVVAEQLRKSIMQEEEMKQQLQNLQKRLARQQGSTATLADILIRAEDERRAKKE